MSNNNFHAMAVVDQDRRLVGIAEREELVSKLMLSLTQSSERWARCSRRGRSLSSGGKGWTFATSLGARLDFQQHPEGTPRRTNRDRD